MPKWYEVYTVVAGAFEGSTSCLQEGAAFDKAQQERDALARCGEDWQVFVLPHYCEEDEECGCSQWLTDHHPLYSSEAERA